MALEFKGNDTPFTLGIEVELQLLDRLTLELTPRASELLAAVNHPRIIKEMFRSTVELVSGVAHDAHAAIDDIDKLISLVRDWGKSAGVVFSSTGTHPMADFQDRMIMPSERYEELLDRNQWLIRRMAVYGLHIHIAMRNGEECIRFANYFLRLLPFFLALSASSPFWTGADTGLDCVRPTMYESHPTSGMPHIAKSWGDLEQLYDDLIHTKSIQSMKDIWWDLRPSPGYGTLELRMCDMPATRKELKAVVAFAHLLALQYDRTGGDDMVPQRWVLRENKWRSIRYGIDAELISHDDLSVYSMREGLYRMLDDMTDLTTRFGYEEEIQTLREIAEKGTSARRQRKIYAATGDLKEVIRHNVNEFALGTMIW